VLEGRNILLGITGSIAAYKSADIARRLIEEGADVHVVMTDAASRFITPYTLEALTGNPVCLDLFKDPFSHINLSKDADLFIIAPVTANTINKLSCGIADDMLGNLWLTYNGPVVMAPAMNQRMYRHASVQKNIKSLTKAGVNVVGPVFGSLACGDEGIGKLADVSTIVEAAIAALTPKDLKGYTVLVTAGPTRESIDPVRYISNRSSGKMGYALAQAANRRGAQVILISGPSSETPPESVSLISVETASEMEKAVMKYISGANVLIMSAAVSDFMPSQKAKVKHDKNDITTLKLKRTIDIIRKVGQQKKKCVLVGFAAETGRLLDRAREKIKDKNLDLIVLNDVTQEGAGFEVDTNIVTIIDKKNTSSEYPIMNKIDVANVILHEIIALKPRKKR
jgi:phosphopantothenoylcysteine decarboxylase/phosphopantothenate--cysteine ligase